MNASNASPALSAVPNNIALANAGLVLTWDDSESILDNRLLRAACRCSGCRFERHKAGLSIDAMLPASDNVAIAGVSSMGYGLQILFNDGHDRGIYPWAYLRELATGVGSGRAMK